MFENEPAIVLGGGGRDGAQNGGDAFELSVTLEDGEKTATLDADKEEALFECIGDLGN